MAKSKTKSKKSPAKKPAARKAAGRKPATRSVSKAKPAKSAAKPALARRSPGKLKLSMMTGQYEIVRALLDGTVQPKGIELVQASYPGSRDIHTRVAVGDGADINEFNGGQFCIVKDMGRDIIGIPVFLHRRFRHGFIFINRNAGIKSPKDLIGDIADGFYVTDLIGMGVNGVTGDYSRGAAGFWIENGEKTYAVSEITIAGHLLDIFKSLMPGNDLEFRYGTNAPTIRVEGLTIAGV